jgi:hypothetical protein
MDLYSDDYLQPQWRGVKHKFLTIKSTNLTFIILNKKIKFLET